MTITVNGEVRSIADDCSVAALMRQLAAPTRGVAVAVDGRVVPRSTWDDTVLREGADVEVLTAVQGG